jgi:hypothetical protein
VQTARIELPGDVAAAAHASGAHFADDIQDGGAVCERRRIELGAGVLADGGCQPSGGKLRRSDAFGGGSAGQALVSVSR